MIYRTGKAKDWPVVPKMFVILMKCLLPKWSSIVEASNMPRSKTRVPIFTKSYIS
jgi:hypothetical protein